MSGEIEVGAVKKKAHLIVGVIPKDTQAIAKHIQVNLELETNGRLELISEQDLISDYIEGGGCDPLCQNEWSAPVRNSVIIHLLEKTEAASNNIHVNGVIIDGSYALDAGVRKAYTDILKEQGFEVVVVPVQSELLSIVIYGCSTGISLKSLYSLWKKYNQQFARTYEPMLDNPSAIVVDENVTDPIFVDIIQLLSDKNRIIVIAKDKRTKYPFDVNHVLVGPDKIDVFWTKIAYHFNVKLVIDVDPYAVHRWHQINVPVICLNSQFSLEKNILQ